MSRMLCELDPRAYYVVNHSVVMAFIGDEKRKHHGGDGGEEADYEVTSRPWKVPKIMEISKTKYIDDKSFKSRPVSIAIVGDSQAGKTALSSNWNREIRIHTDPGLSSCAITGRRRL